MEPSSSAHPAAPPPTTGRSATARVVALALLGYVYVLGVLAALVVAAVGAVILLPSLAVVVWVALPLGFVAHGFFLSLWVRSPQADGIRLAPHDAPELFELIGELRRDLRAPRIHEIRVDAAFNAGVSQYPRLGIIGPYRNVLVVGLPLMLAFPESELRAVLAHELGHVSRQHGRAGAWIYRLRVTWERIALQLDALGTWGLLLFRPFVRWFVPRFERASSDLAHAYEHEADRAAGIVAGAETTGSALVRSALVDAFLSERFWPELWKRSDREPALPGPIALMAQPLRGVGEAGEADRWIAAALDTCTIQEETHPPLRVRLAALGLEPEHVRPRPPRITACAADTLLGRERVATLTETLDSHWQEEAGPTWADQHNSAREGESRLADLEARGAWQQLPLDDLHEYARLASRLRGLEAAGPAWERLLDLEPESGEALLALGELAAERDDPIGYDLLERAALQEPLFAPHALSLLAELLARHGRRADAAVCRRRAGEALALVDQAHVERSRLTPADDVADHALRAETVRKIAAVLDRRQVARAYLARKAPATLTDHYPVYIVGYVRRGGALRYERRGAKGQLEAELFEELEHVMPGPFWLVDLTEDSSRLHHRLRKLDGACVVRGGRSARPLARAAPILVGILLLGGLITRFVDEDKPATPLSSLTPAQLQELAANARYRWAARAEDACGVFRTHADLRLGAVRRERGELDFAEAWAVLRPFEQQVVESLRAPPRIDEGEIAVGLLAHDVQRLDRIARDYAAGRGNAAEARLERFERDDSTERAFAALGVHQCSPTAPIAR